MTEAIELQAYVEGREARLSGGKPKTEAMMRQILSAQDLGRKSIFREETEAGRAATIKEVSAWLKGYEEAENGNQ